ncbi:MAG: YicC family protein [Candidatus Rokubacteria bacterium 13_1_40CM_69_27]|nr:MAG: YicC family protein [Candidatus Rokubacteria bacterium 13_1_40CM_69_27]OLC34537.1 MAG: YicC family protein [Candidatus Rokubacteria bacterium 13_1_40CM_4_69_5]
MIRSMTGFGRAESIGDMFALTVEARSVNHRNLDIAVRLPAVLASLEMEARRLIQSRLERGRIDVTVQLAPAAGQSAQAVRVNTALARRYLAEARALASELGLNEDGTLAWLLERPGVIQLEDAPSLDVAAAWPRLAQALGDALDALVARRTAEGAALDSELRGLVAELAAQTSAMAGRAPLAAARRGERLRERLRALLGEIPLDEARIITEMAVWAQKTDVTEELARLRAHLDDFALTLDKGGPVGRQLDFLIQELNREVNTVAAKADDLELSQAALGAKGVLEKMREQVQNLE